jgi:uncharacterized RDD family membrane protein YckC
MEDKKQGQINKEVDSISVASFSSRILAALIDYFVVWTVSSILRVPVINLLSSSLEPSTLYDFQFIFTLVVGGLYLGLGNSFLTTGQTLGKKIFGLRVIDLNKKKQAIFLSIYKSFFRYFCTFGVIILAAEIPSMYFRNNSIVLPLHLLEFHMLIALTYTMLNASWFVFNIHHRAMHDVLSSSMVIRSYHRILDKSVLEEDIKIFLNQSQALPLAVNYNLNSLLKTIVGILTGTALWYAGIIHSDPMRLITEHKYIIEQGHSIRVISIQVNNMSLTLKAFVLEETNKDYNELAKNIARYILVDDLISPDNVIEEIDFEFITWNDFSPEEIVIDLTNKELLCASIIDCKL